MSGAEIIGLAASVIGIAELGAKLSVKLFTFTRKVKEANKSIEALSQEIAVTGAVLQQLGETLSNDKSVNVCSQEAIDTAKRLISDTEKVFRNLENLLDVQEKPSSKFRMNLKRLKFPFLESEIEQVQANLERLKSSLLVILNVLIFAEQLRNRETLPILQDQRELIRILAAEKDENEQRYERILKAIADRPKPQSDGQSDTSSLHSNTLTLVDPGDDIPHHSVGPTRHPSDKIDEPSEIDLPDGLKLYYERICHHTHLVQNLLSEIDSLEYKLDHGTRGRMHTGVLDVHWNEWNPQRRLFGIHPFEKILLNSTEIATYWADKAINEQLQATQSPPALASSTPNLLKTDESEPLQIEIYATKKLMKENIERVYSTPEVNVPPESPLLSTPLPAPITPSPLPDDRPSEPGKRPHKSVINHHLAADHGKRSRRSRSRSRTSTPVLDPTGLEPPIVPIPIHRRPSPLFHGEPETRLPNLYGDHNDGLDISPDLDMDPDLAFRRNRLEDSAPRGRKGPIHKKQAPSKFGGVEPPAPEPKKPVDEVDEVDALIMRYTNVGGEELRGWSLIGE